MLPEATILSSLPSAQLIGRLGLSLPSVDVDAFVPYYLKRVEAEENWLKTHEETNRDNYIKRFRLSSQEQAQLIYRILSDVYDKSPWTIEQVGRTLLWILLSIFAFMTRSCWFFSPSKFSG